MAIRIGLVGYGVGGRLFHAPYLQASDQCELVGVVARSSERIAQVHEDLPDVPVFSSLEDLADAGVDAVVISTPPTTRQALVLEALGLGMHVVADKPFAPSAAAARPGCTDFGLADGCRWALRRWLSQLAMSLCLIIGFFVLFADNTTYLLNKARRRATNC